MIRRVLAALLRRSRPRQLGAQTFAIIGGTVALGDGSQPIPNGMVVFRDGRIVAAGDVRMKLPAGTQVIDATGKWVTPGIVAGFSRLGLAEVDLCGRDGVRTTYRRRERAVQRGDRCRAVDQPARHDRSPSIAPTASLARSSRRTSARAFSPVRAR